MAFTTRAAAEEDPVGPEPAAESSIQEQQGEHRIEDVVVTASRRAETRTGAPTVVKVITAQEIQRLPWQNFQDLLNLQLGITTFSFQGVGSGFPQDIRIRGTRGTERVLLLVDGQPWNSPFQDYWFFSSVPVEAIERIEIVRGPFSALYGSNAEGGLILRLPQPLSHGRLPPQHRVREPLPLRRKHGVRGQPLPRARARLVNYPCHLARAGAVWYSRHFRDFLGLGASVVARFSSDYWAGELFGADLEKINGHTLVDTRVGIDFWKPRVQVFGEVLNVGNEQEFINNKGSYLAMRNDLVGGAVRFAF